uniref:Vacuolar protein sorting-associated protein 52 homolog n=1 Tax=Syphacia muris TaxID=451379 RepID=A0A0N5AW57_9BILA
MYTHLFTLFMVKIGIAFNLQYVSLDPMPKPVFLTNATEEIIEQFMGLLRVPFIDARRKVSELDILVGSLRPEIQEAYEDLKCQAIMAKLEDEDQQIEFIEKTHYVIAHLNALKAARKVGQLERKKRIEMVFAEYNEYVVQTVVGRVQKILENTMNQITRTVLFSERLSIK